MPIRIGHVLIPALLLAGCASVPAASQPEAPAAGSATAEATPATPSAAAEQTTAPEAPAEAEAASAEQATDASTAAEDGRQAEETKEDKGTVAPVDSEAARKAIAGLDDKDIIGRGKASYYHLRFSGRRTASGQHYDHDAMTAAHRTLPFGTRVRVTNTRNGRSVVVRINDRGPFIKSRVIDVSGAAARALGLMHHGLAEVILSKP